MSDKKGILCRFVHTYVSAIQIFCFVINTDVFVSSVCLEDVLSFIRSSQACAFRKADFDNISNDRGIRESCVSDTQCENGTTNSICNETSGVCQCKAGYMFMWESSTCSPVKRETEKTKSSQTGLVMGVGVAGLVLGVAVCGLLYFILIHYKKKYQIRRNKEIREEAFVQVSCSLNPKLIDNRQGNDNVEGLGVYNHLHEPVNISVQPDYDQVPQHGVDDDDYSHIKACNANQIDNLGEYGVIS